MGVRHLVMFLTVAASVSLFVNRTNLNIAIVPMTAKTIDSNAESSHETDYGCAAKPMINKSSSHEPASLPDAKTVKGKSYNWDQTTQGKILGSFFWSYFIFMIPAGMLAEKFGARIVIFATLAGPAAVSLAVPFITDYHYSILIASRFLLGVFQSGFYPAAYGMATKWFPLKERSIAFALIDIGAVLGSVVTYLTAGLVIDLWGWPFLFYIPGVASFIMGFIFLFGVRSEPQEHPLVKENELKLISSVEFESKKKVRKASPDWAMILTCPSVLATAFFKFSCMLGMSLIYLELPKYLSEVIHENINDNGNINALIFIVCIISLTMNGFLSEFVIQKEWLSRTATRKTFSLFSGTLAGVCMALIPVVGCNTVLLRVLLCLNAFFAGFVTGSDGPIVSEMTKNFPSTLYALFNMVAMSTGFVVPYVVGLVLDSFGDPTAGWPVVFYGCAGLIVVANIVYVCFAQAERQDFDMIMDEEEERVFTRGVDYGARRSISPLM